MNTTVTARSVRILLAATMVAAVAVLTLAPQGVVDPARRGFFRVMSAAAAPVSEWLPSATADEIMNLLLFVPLGAALALVLARWAWPAAVLAGGLLSATVEYAQASIPGRVPDPNDILWNTVGGAIGVVAVTVVRLIAVAIVGWRGRRQRGSTART